MSDEILIGPANSEIPCTITPTAPVILTGILLEVGGMEPSAGITMRLSYSTGERDVYVACDEITAQRMAPWLYRQVSVKIEVVE